MTSKLTAPLSSWRARMSTRKKRGTHVALRWALTHPRLGGGRLLRLDFPPSASSQPRFGYGRPPHRRISELLSQGDDEYRGLLERFAAEYGEQLRAIPMTATDPREPHWRNPFLFGIDGASLYCFVRERAPRRYLEIGSGNSTLFVDRARRDGGLTTEVISIDPHPRREIDEVCDRVIRAPLETVDLSVFSELETGDIVFIDGTHRVFTNSDAVVFFLDVLPDLPPGVLVGIHDVHLPDDYRPEHANRYYSEQYLLATYLLAEPEWMRPVLPCWYASGHQQLEALARSLLPDGLRSRGVIFWLQTRPRSHVSAHPPQAA